MTDKRGIASYTCVIHVGVIEGSNGAVELIRFVVTVYHSITTGVDG